MGQGIGRRGLFKPYRSRGPRPLAAGYLFGAIQGLRAAQMTGNRSPAGVFIELDKCRDPDLKSGPRTVIGYQANVGVWLGCDDGHDALSLHGPEHRRKWVSAIDGTAIRAKMEGRELAT